MLVAVPARPMALLMFAAISMPAAAQEPAPRDGYATLVQLFHDWRAFERPPPRSALVLRDFFERVNAIGAIPVSLAARELLGLDPIRTGHVGFDPP